jgi:transcription termination factor NusB
MKEIENDEKARSIYFKLLKKGVLKEQEALRNNIRKIL